MDVLLDDELTELWTAVAHRIAMPESYYRWCAEQGAAHFDAILPAEWDAPVNLATLNIACGSHCLAAQLTGQEFGLAIGTLGLSMPQCFRFALAVESASPAEYRKATQAWRDVIIARRVARETEGKPDASVESGHRPGQPSLPASASERDRISEPGANRRCVPVLHRARRFAQRAGDPYRDPRRPPAGHYGRRPRATAAR